MERTPDVGSNEWVGTLILFWRVPDHSIEEANLAEEHGNEEGGASGVGGGGQEERHPRSHREH